MTICDHFGVEHDRIVFLADGDVANFRIPQPPLPFRTRTAQAIQVTKQVPAGGSFRQGHSLIDSGGKMPELFAPISVEDFLQCTPGNSEVARLTRFAC